MKIHPVVFVSHTTPFVVRPDETAQPMLEKRNPIPAIGGDEHVVEKILSQRKKGREFQFLTLTKGLPTHDAVWKPTKDFADRDGTVTDVWHDYIWKRGFLPQYY